MTVKLFGLCCNWGITNTSFLRLTLFLKSSTCMVKQAKSIKYQGIFEVKSREKTRQVWENWSGVNNWSISKSQKGMEHDCLDG